MEAAGTAVVEGGWGGAVCPPVAPRGRGLGALRSAAGGISRWHTWPWLQPVPRVPAESRCTPRCHGGHAPPSPAGSGDWGRRGTRSPASAPHPAKCSRILPASHRFSPTGCFSSCPRFSRGREAAPCPVRPRGRRCGDGPAGGSGGERSKQKNEKSPPALRSAAPTKALVPRAGENPSRGAKQRCPSPPSLAASSGRRSPGPGG